MAKHFRPPLLPHFPEVRKRVLPIARGERKLDYELDRHAKEEPLPGLIRLYDN